MELLRSKKGKLIAVSAVALVIILIVVIVLLFTSGANGYRSISISELFGNVIADNNGSEYPAYEDMMLYDGYALTTSSDSYSRLVLDGDKYIKLEEDSRAVFEKLGKASSGLTTIKLERGAITNELTRPLSADEDYVVNTPNAVLGVRGTFFRVEVKYDINGDAYSDVYVFGGEVVCRRIMPDGSMVEEEVRIPAGYKACVKMDDVITVYIEELIEEQKDHIDPINSDNVSDDDLVDMYVASYNGHDMFLSTKELWDEINRRDIDVGSRKSHYDGGKLPHFDDDKVSTEETDTEDDNSVIPETVEGTKPVESAESPETAEDTKPVESAESPHTVEVTKPAETPEASETVEVTKPAETPEAPDTVEVTEPAETPEAPDTVEATEPVETPEAPDTVEVTEPAETPEAPDTVEATEPTETPEAPDTVEVTEPAETPEAPETVEVTEPAETPEAPETVEVTEPVETPETPDTVEATEPAETPEAPETVEVTEPAETPEAPETVEVTEPAETPEAPDTVEMTEPAETPEAPETVEVTEPAETPEAPETVEVTEPAETPEAPETVEVTEPAETPEAPDTVEVTEPAETPEAPDTVEVTETVETAEVPETAENIETGESTETGTTEIKETAETAETSETEEVLPFDGTLYTDDGNIVITSSGVTQGDATEETPWTGDYIITQTSGDAVAASVTVQSGTHNITLAGINASADRDVFAVSVDAQVTLNSSASNTFTTTSDGISGIHNRGTLYIESGEYSIAADNFGIYNDGVMVINGGTINTQGDSAGIDNENTLTINGGTINAVGVGSSIWGYGIYNNAVYIQNGGSVTAQGGTVEDICNNTDCTAVITGGSLCLANNALAGDVLENSGGEALEVNVFDALPAAVDITRWNGAEYAYSISASDAAADGKFYVWVPVFDGTVYMEDGSVTITDTGITQGEMTAEYAFAGGYVISQRDSASRVDDICVTFESGTHNVTMNNTYLRGESAKSVVYVSSGATVNLSGNNNILISTATYVSGLDISGVLNIGSGTFDFDGISITGSVIIDNADIELRNSINVKTNGEFALNSGTINVEGVNIASAFVNSGSVSINGGTSKLTGNQYGISNSGSFILTNGSIVVSGDEADINTSNAVNVTGGSLRAVNNTVNGSITNGTDELECIVYDTFPGESERTFTRSNGTTYVYDLTEADCADDGKYYVWKPIDLGVALDATKFPDEVFRTYVSDNFDTDTNGYLSDDEISAATEITVGGTSAVTDGGVTSLEGIEYLTELTTLKCGYNSALTDIDISGNGALTTLYCYNTGITSLDVSRNTELNLLYCSNTQITELDLSANTSLSELYCVNTGITVLDVSNNTALTGLDCNDNALAEIDISQNTALTRLCCQNTNITSLDLSNNIALTHLNCGKTGITDLDVSSNTALKYLYCDSIAITSLDTSHNTALTYLHCNDTGLVDIDLSGNTALTRLYCYNTAISSLDLTNNIMLEDLLFYNNAVAYIDVSNNTGLIAFLANGNAYVIPSDATTFDLSTIDGFDASRASNWTNCTYDSMTNTLTGITGDVTYTYNCGMSFSETFTLSRTG